MKVLCPDAKSVLSASYKRKHTLIRDGEIAEEWKESTEGKTKTSSPSIAYMGFGGHSLRLA